MSRPNHRQHGGTKRRVWRKTRSGTDQNCWKLGRQSSSPVRHHLRFDHGSNLDAHGARLTACIQIVKPEASEFCTNARHNPRLNR
jgi:hypothetical protein